MKQTMLNNQMIYLGFWKRILMRLIDFVILVIPYLILYRIADLYSTSTLSLLPYIMIWVISCSFYVITVSRYGGTPGKLIMKAKIMDENGNKLTISKSILRSIFYILYGIAMIVTYNEETLKHHLDSPFQTIAEGIGLIAILSDFFVLFNKRKRALHDYIAGSFVVRKY